MKVTFILQDFADVFFTGNGGLIVGLNSLSDAEKYEKLNTMSHDGRVKQKIGNGSFRDRVELNQIRRDCAVSYKIEPRRGYKLATFEFRGKANL